MKMKTTMTTTVTMTMTMMILFLKSAGPSFVLIIIGSSAREAAEKSLKHMSDRIHGFGGVIVVGRNGEIAHVFTTPRMAWASIGGASGLLRHGINSDEDIAEEQ